MIVSDIQTRVKRQFGDESGVQIADADIIRWINEGQRHIVSTNEGLLEKTAVSSSQSNIQSYPLPIDILILQSVSYQDLNQLSYIKLKAFSMNQFNEYVDGWDGSTFAPGTPTIFTVFANQLLIFPIPTLSVPNAFKIFYTRTPTDVVGVTDTPDLPLLYHDVLVKYCMQQAYETDANFQGVWFKNNEIATDISTLRGRNDWKAQANYPVITVLSEDAY